MAGRERCLIDCLCFLWRRQAQPRWGCGGGRRFTQGSALAQPWAGGRNRVAILRVRPLLVFEAWRSVRDRQEIFQTAMNSKQAFDNNPEGISSSGQGCHGGAGATLGNGEEQCSTPTGFCLMTRRRNS